MSRRFQQIAVDVGAIRRSNGLIVDQAEKRIRREMGDGAKILWFMDPIATPSPREVDPRDLPDDVYLIYCVGATR